MKKILFFIAMTFQCIFLFSQEKGVVLGRVLDSINQEPLKDASVVVSRLEDKSRIGIAISNTNGWYHLLNIPMYDSLVVEISFAGYELFRGLLVLNEKRFTMNAVYLHPGGRPMDTVLVKARPPLMVIKKDTIEFNAALFKTLPNAMAEDLLKKIPGLIIDDQGRLTFNGRPVNRILVDGKIFFSIDGRVAMKNIPVDLIKKVQISVDDAPVNEVGNSIARQKVQTLNIRLKEGNKLFGNARAAYGTNQRYDLSGLINRANEKEQLSLLAGWNNINKTDPGPDAGSSITIPGNGEGITRSVTSGLNYTRDFKNGAGLHAVYAFARPVTYNESVQETRQNFVGDSSLFSYSGRRFTNTSNNHSFSMEFHKNYFYVSTTVSSLLADNNVSTQSSTAGTQGILINDLQNNYITKNNQKNWQTDISYSVPFTKKDRFLKINAGYSMQWQNNNDNNYGLAKYYENNTPDSQSVIRQAINVNNKNNSARAGIQYTEPIGKGWQWKVINNFLLQFGSIDKITWQLDGNGNKHSIDSLYSNSFVSSILTNETISGFNYEGGKWAGNFGMGLQLNSLYNYDRTHAETFRNNRISLVPQLNIAIRKNPAKKSLTLNMSAQTTNPSKDQLQPVADNSNPLYILQGNPALRSSIQYTTGITYFKLLSQQSGATFSVNGVYNNILNKITSFVKYDSLGRQISYYVNINGAWSSSVTVSTVRRFTSGSNVFAVGTNSIANFSHDRFYLNELLLDVNMLSLLPTLHFRYSHGNVINVFLRYAPVYNRTHYKQNPDQDQQFWIQNITGSLDLYAFKRLKWKNSIRYSYNSSLGQDFDKSSILLNMELAWLCFKNKRGEISFTAFDLLKQNRNISHRVANNYIEDSQSTILQQYFMIGFFWQLSKINQNKAAQL